MERNCDLSKDLCHWLYKFDQDLDTKSLPKHFSVFRRVLFDLLSEGLRGVAISEKLKELENLVTQECRRNLDEACLVLPYKGLAPLMLFMFPALILLILGPVMKEFMEVLN